MIRSTAFAPVMAQTPGRSGAEALETGLWVIDWVIIVAYALGTILLGWYFSRRQRTTSEYFVGSGQMNPILIGISLFATLLSAISYMSMPGESIGKGPAMMAALLAQPFVFLTVAYLLLPVYKRQSVTSAYELLESQLGLSVRLLGATMFILLRLIWMSVMIFIMSSALADVFGVGSDWIPMIAFVAGSIALIYTSLGGLKAVVITDALQTILLYGGALTVIGVVTWRMGGFSWFPTQWNENWDQQPLFPDTLSTRSSFFGAVLMTYIWGVCTMGADQTSVQRFMAVKDVSASQKALGIQLITAAIVSLTLGLVGLALLGYFTAHPDQLSPALDLKGNADKIFPFFIAHELPPVVSGFVVAALLAATMSSIDSGVNSITAVVMTDYLDRFGRSPKNDRQHTIMSRWLAAGIGLFVILVSSQWGSIPGNFTALTKKVVELLTTPLFGLFFFAVFVPFARPRGVWAGAICGTLTAIVIAFSGPLTYWLYETFQVDPAALGAELITKTNPITQQEYQTCSDPISFQWIGLFALTVNIAVGSLVSWGVHRSREDSSIAS